MKHDLSTGTPPILQGRSECAIYGPCSRGLRPRHEKTTAHRGANGAAMPTEEDDQDGSFSLIRYRCFARHPRKCLPRTRAKSH